MTFSFWALCARVAPLSVPQEVPLRHFDSFLNPIAFHAGSLVLHLLNTTLVFLILRRFQFAPWACAAGALVFALDPVQVEAVAWVTGANNLMAGFFGFLALYLYLLARPAASPTSSRPTKAQGRLFLCLATAAFVCALFSKPTATILPLSIAAIELIVFRNPWRRWIGLVQFWCVLSGICAVVSRAATNDGSRSVGSPLWGRPFVGDALAILVIRLAAPALTLDYARPPEMVLK